MRRRQATIADVAELAGVTRSVVSVVLSGRTGTIRVSETTRDRVLRAAREVNYHPSLIARGLQERKSFLLAYLCTGGGSWGVSTRLLRSIQNACRQHDYSLAVYPSDSLEEERVNLRAALDRQVDGVIVSPFMAVDKTNTDRFRKIAESGLPVVQLGRILTGIPGVARDCRRIGFEAAELLIREGRRKIVFVTYENYEDPLTGPSSFAEYEGCREAVENAGLSLNVIPVAVSGVTSGSSVDYKSIVMENAFRQIKIYLKKHSLCPDAFLVSSNSLGYGAGLCCRELGWNIPDRTAIISCSDDYVLPASILPRLSGFPMDAVEIGRAAVERCLDPIPGSSGITLIRQPYLERESFHSIQHKQTTKGTRS